MNIIKINDAGGKFTYKWPENEEIFENYIEYTGKAEDGEHIIKIGFCKIRWAFGKDRFRVVVWIDGIPEAEFFGAEDFELSGEVLSEIKVSGTPGERICRYPDELIPERYMMFNVVGLPNRAKGPYLHNAWGVVANIADHKTLIALAALRKFERKR